ncbi:tight junction protein ZO-1 isoform X3 [Anopheles stephensi]|uniref:tight junction protein ZO-1 isoform X3 n=1 Tax=Anopheles stephensi TaxID=30069 RepID=UPI0016589218|nr:tight junction protein ZO-1 isoform X3 [Anopheles stephensi]
MADETGEVRSLLMRHRLSIVRDLIGTSLLQVLLKAGVLTPAQEEQLTGEPSLDARCDQLIELIARDGFEKFKQFCYAIESECSQLISDLINDKLSQVEDDDDDGVANIAGSTGPSSSDPAAIVQLPAEGAPFAVPEAMDIAVPGVTHDDSSLKNGRDTIDSNRSRRSTSYCGTSTPTPTTVPISNTVSSRRSSLISATASSASNQQQQPPPIPQLPSKTAVAGTATHIDLAGCESKFAVSNNNFNNSSVSNGSNSSNNNNQSNNHRTSNGDSSATANGVPDASVLRSIRQALGQGHLPPSNKRLQKSESAAYSYFNPKRFSSPPFGEMAGGGGTTDRRLNLKNKTASLFRSKSKKEQRTYHRSVNETIEVLADQVVEDEKVLERTSWDYSTVTLSRVTGYGFGIAVSGGRDNPHFANGDPSIAVSDVLKNGPAEGQLQVNDRIISVNGVSLENVEYATAVQVLRDSGNTVTLMVKRRVPNHSLMHPLPGANMHGMTAGPGGPVGLSGGPAGPGGGGGGGAMGGLSTSVVGMNSHQHQHSISSTGLGLGANNGSQQQIKVIVTKANKKDDFGIVLGCRLFIREISSKTKDQLAANGYSLQEGDLVTRIHNTNCNDSMSLKEAKKIIDGCKERLTLAVLREPNGISGSYGGGAAGGTASGMQSPVYSHTAQVSNCSNMDENYLNGTGGGSYSGQNLYVQPPTRPSAMSTLLADDKSNLTPRGRSRGPLTDISLQQLDRPSTPPGTSSRTADGGAGHSRSRSVVDEPPRPPPPRGEDFYATRRQLMDEKPPTAEPRYITFQKEGSVGIRLTGGNEVGIFVTAVQQNSPASVQGLVTGDKILKVNDMDMNGVTREEAVLFLLSLQDRIDLIVQYCKEEFDTITAQQRGDSFHIKTHFHCDAPTKGELSFKAGDVFRVIDTLYNGVVGAWQVLRIGRGHQELQRGVIPNKARAEELATVQFNASKKELNASESRVSFFRRRRSTHRRSKSLSRENWDDVVFSDAISKFPAYERVVLRHPGFVRPVVIFGPVADIARERLMKDFPDKYTAPLQDDDKGSSKCGGIVRLSNIRDIMDRGKHALLDVTPNAVDRLNYAQFYPIVIFLKADTKHTIKQMRQGLPKSAHKSSKKLFEQCQKLERVWSHVFSTTINLNDPDTWYRKLRDSIDQQQSGAVWMSETKPVESLSDDFLFPMTTSRLSYASSPESDLELSPGPSASLSLGNLPQLVKSSSDPSIATNQDNLDRDRELGDGMPPPYTNPYEHAPHARRMTVDNKYGFSSSKNGGGAPAMNPDDAIYGSSTARAAPPLQGSANGPHFGAVPDLPPRIDRASKPPNGPGAPSTSGSSLPSRNSSSGGTLGRSAQERLFGNGKQSAGDALHDPSSAHDEYSSRSQLLGHGGPDKRPALPPMVNGGGGPMAGTPGTGSANTSLDRSGGGGHHHPASGSNPNTSSGKANGSYDSVSSYDSYNTSSQLTAQNMSNRNGAHPMGGNASGDYGRNPSMNSTASDMLLTTAARSNYNGTGGAHEALTQRNSGDRSGPGMNMPQRPTNLVLDSPRKHLIETKTDYGKYSRNNSASQADYSKPNKGPSMIGSPGQPPGGGGGAMGANMGNGAPFKPVPPPKPKNYRPPVGGAGTNGSGMHHAGQWDNGEPISPRSPDGFYYPPMASSHYHQGMAHNVPSSPNNGGSGHGPAMHPYNPYTVGSGANGGNGAPMYNGNGNGSHSYMSNGGVRDVGTMGASNGYNSGNAQYPYGNTYMHRGNGTGTHGIGNMPAIHPTDRHALDLAGSREQRGSAFELYRKPQLGTMVGHHHNIRDMEPMMSIHEFNQHQQHLMHQERMRQLQQQPLPPIPGPPPRGIPYPGHDPSLPPELPAKPPKKNILKSPLKAIKNAFIKSTRPLRRQVSLAGDADKKSLRPILKRQHSMMEPRSARMRLADQQQQQLQQMYDQRAMYAQELQQQQQQAYYNDPRYSSSYQGPYSPQPVRGFQRHEAYYPKDGNSTYQNLELESMYGHSQGRAYYDGQQNDGQSYYQPDENLYANRALIELERGRAAPLGPGATVSTLGRRIVRRHSMADRTAPSPSFNQLNRRRMGSERAPHHASIVDHHRHHQRGAMASVANVSGHGSGHDESIYQSKSGSFLYNEAREHTRRTFDEPVYQSRREMHRDHLYQSKQQMQDRIQQSRLVEMQSQQTQPPGSSPASGGNGSGTTTTSTASDRFLRNQGVGAAGGGPASGSCSSSPNSPSSSSCKSGYSSSRNGGEMRERRTQMREQIYQSRKEAMESMAEPVYVSRRELKHEPIYESKNEHAEVGDLPVSEMEGLCLHETEPADSGESKSEKLETIAVAKADCREDQNSRAPFTLGAPLAAEEDDDDVAGDVEEEQDKSGERTLTVSNQNDSAFDKLPVASPGSPVATSSPVPSIGTPKSIRATHISNFLKRTAPPVMPPPPPPPTAAPRPSHPAVPDAAAVYASRTSIETQYTAPATGSQMSLPIGPPNATSTPFASELSLGLPPPRQPITRRGLFDASGGSLADPVWNVSLQIPPGAIAPGVQQEIYFTVTDPRLSESVGGPPLDMENGETMLSPLVMCGPQGTEFLKPVTLNIPHCAGRTASLGLSLKATDSEKNLQTDWEDIDLPSNTAAHTVSVKVDHF